jgi:hypothetical protein
MMLQQTYCTICRDESIFYDAHASVETNGAAEQGASRQQAAKVPGKTRLATGVQRQAGATTALKTSPAGED